MFKNERIILKADNFLLGYAGLNQELQCKWLSRKSIAVISQFGENY